MSHRARVFRSAVVAVAAGLALLGGVGVAQAADDDFEFAQALYQRGYTDLAEEKFLELLNDPKRSASEKAEGQYGLALLKRFNALVAALEDNDRRRKPLPEVLKLFGESDDALAQFIDRNPTHGRVLEAKLDRAKLLQDRADYVNRAVENDWVPSDVTVSDLKAQVAEGYNTAIGLLEAVERKARTTYESAQIGSPERAAAEDRLGLVWLYRISALYGKGAALPTGDSSGIAALNKALNEIEEFMWIFDGTVRGLWAFHYGGLVSAKLDNPRDAVQYMRDACSALRESDGVPAARAITMRSYAELARMAPGLAERHGDEWMRAALQTLGRMEQDWPSYLNDRDGQRAALQYARLLNSAGKGEEALLLVQDVIRRAEETQTRMDTEAGRVLGEMIGGAGSTALDPELLDRIAQSKYDEAQFRDAIRAYQGVIAASRSDDDVEKWAWPAWNRIGQSYWLLGRWYEAHLAFDVLEKAWEADQSNQVLSDITDNSGFSRAAALDRLANETTDAAQKKKLKAEAKAILEEFADKHPNSPHNLNVEEANAANKLSEAKALLRQDPAAGNALLREAIKALQGIQKSSPVYDKIEAQLADAQRLLGENDKAIAMAEAWLAKTRPSTVDSRVKRSRLQGKAIALTTIMTASVAKADAARAAGDKAAYETACKGVLDTLAKHEKEFLDSVQKGQRLVDQWRCEALIGRGEAQKADELVSKLMESARTSPNTRYLAALVAKAREEEAKTWKAKGDEGRYRNLMLRAARLREYVVMEFGSATPEGTLAVAKTYQKAGDLEKAEAYMLQAQNAYEKLAAEATDPQKKSDYEGKTRSIRVERIDLLVDQAKYDEAIGDLEVLLVPIEENRATVLDRLGKDDQINSNELTQLLALMSPNRRVMDVLSRAYLEARGSRERLLRSINLCAILRFAHPKDSRHDEDWVAYTLRLSRAYYQFGLDENHPPAFQNVIVLIQNGVVTPGLLDEYEAKVPGSKKQFEEMLSDSKTR